MALKRYTDAVKMATLQEALDEAYATATNEEIPLHAMEINHPAFETPLRVIRWPVTGPEPDKFVCKHEPTADIDPNKNVDYYGFPYELTLPESSQDSEGSFNFRCAIYNNFDEWLLKAAMTQGVLKATYRQYIKGRELEGPAVVWPDIQITAPRREGGDILADGVILRWMRKPFGGLYLPIDYPALVTGR
jgi:hypothetical protein